MVPTVTVSCLTDRPPRRGSSQPTSWRREQIHRREWQEPRHPAVRAATSVSSRLQTQTEKAAYLGSPGGSVSPSGSAGYRSRPTTHRGPPRRGLWQTAIISQVPSAFHRGQTGKWNSETRGPPPAQVHTTHAYTHAHSTLVHTCTHVCTEAHTNTRHTYAHIYNTRINTCTHMHTKHAIHINIRAHTRTAHWLVPLENPG